MATTKGYIAPALTIRGSLADLTQAQANGNSTDKTFPNDTPKNQLTFS